MGGEIFSFTKNVFLGDELDILVANKELLAKISDRLTSLGWSMGRGVADAFQLGESIKMLAEYEARKYAESLRDSWEAGSEADWCGKPITTSECISDHGLVTFVLELPRCSDDKYSLDIYNFGKRKIQRLSVQEALAAFSYYCAIYCEDLCHRAANLREMQVSSRRGEMEHLINDARTRHVEGMEALHFYRHPLISRKENYAAPQSCGADLRAYLKDIVELELHRIVSRYIPICEPGEWGYLIDVGRKILNVGRNRAADRDRLYQSVAQELKASRCLPEKVLGEIAAMDVNPMIDAVVKSRFNYLSLIVGSGQSGAPSIESDSDRAIHAWIFQRDYTKRKIRKRMADDNRYRIALKMRVIQFSV